jgi:hypothetical protein
MCGCSIVRKTNCLSCNCGLDCCNPDSECNCAKDNVKKFNTENNIVVEPKWFKFKNQEDEQQTKDSDEATDIS